MNNALKKSIALHLAVFLMFIIDLPMFWRNRLTMDQVPIIVDLKDVKISEVTNLPPKAKFGDEDKAATRTQPQKEKPQYSKEQPDEEEVKPQDKKAEKAEPEKEQVAPEPKKDYLAAPQPKKPQAPKKPAPKKIMPPKAKPKPKPQPKPAPKKEDDSKPQLANPLKSLLASVDQMEKSIGAEDTEATIKTGTEVNNMALRAEPKGLISANCQFRKLMRLPVVCEPVGIWIREQWALKT